MALDTNDPFDALDTTVDAPVQSPAPDGDQSAPPAPPQARDELTGRVDALTSALNTLLLQQRQAPPPVYAPSPPAPPPPTTPQGWQHKDFLTPSDAVLLLTSPDPAGQLNKAFNAVAETVYGQTQEQLRQRDMMLLAIKQEQDQRYQQDQFARQAASNQDRLYTLYPGLRPFASLVPQEATAIARESLANPALYAGKTDADIYGLLAARVAARVNAIRAVGSEEDQVPPTPSPSASYRMERGGGARVPQAPGGDANTQELQKMTRTLRGGR